MTLVLWLRQTLAYDRDKVNYIRRRCILPYPMSKFDWNFVSKIGTSIQAQYRGPVWDFLTKTLGSEICVFRDGLNTAPFPIFYLIDMILSFPTEISAGYSKASFLHAFSLSVLVHIDNTANCGYIYNFLLRCRHQKCLKSCCANQLIMEENHLNTDQQLTMYHLYILTDDWSNNICIQFVFIPFFDRTINSRFRRSGLADSVFARFTTVSGWQTGSDLVNNDLRHPRETSATPHPKCVYVPSQSEGSASNLLCIVPVSFTTWY